MTTDAGWNNCQCRSGPKWCVTEAASVWQLDQRGSALAPISVRLSARDLYANRKMSPPCSRPIAPELRETGQPALPTVEALPNADIVDGRWQLVNGRSANGGFWDEAAEGPTRADTVPPNNPPLHANQSGRLSVGQTTTATAQEAGAQQHMQRLNLAVMHAGLTAVQACRIRCPVGREFSSLRREGPLRYWRQCESRFAAASLQGAPR